MSATLRGQGDPDFTPAGWAVQAPGSRLRRRRDPPLLVLAVLLAVAGVAATATGAVRLAGFAPGEDEVAARGTVAALRGPDGAGARFDSPGPVSFTVWISTDVQTIHRDTVVAATTCEAALADGSSRSFRGSRQGAALSAGGQATVGVFRAVAGPVSVACRQVEWGRIGRHYLLRKERDFRVVAGRPSERTGGFYWVFGGVALALAALPVWSRWGAGRLRPV